MKASVFCSHGLGDGLLFLIISNNLRKNGYDVSTYHLNLEEIKDWFPNLKIKSSLKDINKEKSDLIIINSDKRKTTQELIKYYKQNFPKKTWILHITTCAKKNLPGDYRFNRNLSVVENLYLFCKNSLNLPFIQRENGIFFKKDKKFRKNMKRIVVHPSGNKENYRWDKYVPLAKKLIKDGFNVSFIVSKKERKDWEYVIKEGIDLPYFETLTDTASYIYESGFMIGNNSGIGHLASCLKIPTLTIFSTKRQKNLWRPDWGFSYYVLPFSLIPNMKMMRLKEKYWKNFICVNKVYKEFCKRYESCYFLC